MIWDSMNHASVTAAGPRDQATTFTFYTYGDTIEELRDYIEENWRDSRIADRTVERTREALRHAAGVRPRTREVVHVTRLRPHHA